MDEITKKAVNDSIDHWKRMIEWAKKQNPQELVIAEKMFNEIGEDWYGRFCPLCKIYYNGISLCVIEGEICPLYEKYGGCGRNGNAWASVAKATTWGEWVSKAEIMLSQLESLLE
jgi:hypothetical protein